MSSVNVSASSINGVLNGDKTPNVLIAAVSSILAVKSIVVT